MNPNTGSFRHDNTEAVRSERVMPLFSLKGRTAIVTGAGAGIGLGIAQALAEAGANVAIWYNSNMQALKRAEEIGKEYGVKCKAYKVSITSPSAVEKAINEIVTEFNGRLDIFVANSGISYQGSSIDGPIEPARRVLEINVEGIMWCARSAGAHFRRQKTEGSTTNGKKLEGFKNGSFIATASISGSVVCVPQQQAVYNASKAAVIQYCKSLAVEWTGFARVNVVSPGYIRTETAEPAGKVKGIWKDKTVMG